MDLKAIERSDFMITNCKTLNVRELAKYLGIGMNSAYQLVNSNGFPALKIGKRIVVPIEKLEQWVDANTPTV